MDTLLQDVRYALRVLRKSPGFTLVSVLTLALGIVGTTLVLNAYNALVWQPLPADKPEQLAVLERNYRKGGKNSQFTGEDYVRIRDHNHAFSGVAAEGGYDTVLAQFPEVQTGKPEEPRQALIKLVSENYFEVLGVGAAAGRVFHSDARKDNAPVAVLSYTSWHRRFRDNLAVIGQTVMIYGAPVTIVGIAPKEFVGSGHPPVPPDFWIPLSAEPVIEPQRVTHNAADPWLRIFGRLATGKTASQAQSELTATEQQNETDNGREVVTASITAAPAIYFVEPDNPAFRAMAALLLASFSMVLLVACANMANFFMARATARRREMAVRSALGASRVRLARQLITEGMILGLAGGCVATIAATWVCDFVWFEVETRLIGRFTDLYYFVFTFSPSARVLVATTVVSILAGALFSLAGAVQSSRVDLNEVMKGYELKVAPGRRFRLNMRDLLIAVQVMLSVVLLVSAAVLARGMVRGQFSDPGFNTYSLLDIEFAGLDAAGYDNARMTALRGQLRASLSAIPGVTGVTFESHVPMLGMSSWDISASGGVTHRAPGNDVSPEFFSTIGIPLLRGRGFGDGDLAKDSAVVIVSQATARNLWPGQDPIGKILLLGKKHRAVQVIGVAQDVRSVNIGMVEPYFIYMPLTLDQGFNDVLIRTSGDANRTIPEALKRMTAIDRKLASLAVAHGMDDALMFQRMPSTIATILAAVVGSLALILASVGIYGTIAYAVAQRTREIGIRMALGAPRLSIVKLVIARTMALIGGGGIVGLLAAAGVSTAVASVPFGLQSVLLFDTSPRDPLTLASVALFLAAVALAAAYRPAVKATKVDPMIALRYE